jgi:ParB-like chromosome segregation protein Spo0J
LFPELAADEFAALKADIAERGVLVPVEYDEHGNVLDGHHRVRACRELGIKDWPTVTRGGMDDEAKAEHVLTLNLSRRHLTRDQRRELVKRLRVERGWSLRRIAGRLGVSHVQVSRDVAEAGVTSVTPARVEGSDGKSYAAKKPEPAPSIFTPSNRQQERAGAVLRELGDTAPAKPIAVNAAERMARNRTKEAVRQEVAAHAPDPADCDLREGDFRQVLVGLDGTVDAIITDPPYPAEYLPLLSDLSDHAARLLKPGGICAVMIGQSYLPDVYRRLTERLHYHWTVAYLTPGGQAAQLWDRKVNTFWKPVIILTNGEPTAGRWFGDVSRSDVNDNDKRHHHWGQSESGTADLIERLTAPGDVVCDPFLGGGTTAAVALRLARKFVGAELEPEMVATARRRIAAEVAA